MTQLQALIFDVDGTLAETERDGHRVAFNRAFKAIGLNWHWSVEQYGELLEIAGGKERLHHYLTTSHPDFQAPPDYGSLQGLITSLHQAKNRFYQQVLQAHEIPLRYGVRRLIEEARQQRVRLAIATTSTPENAAALLESTLGSDSLSWFEVIAAGDMVPQKKPAPDVYHYVLQKLALPPTACLAIEDSYPGLVAASRAGLKTVVTVNRYTQHQDMGQAVAVLTHLGDPEHPCEVLAGYPDIGPIFTLAAARQIHAAGRVPVDA